MLLSTDSDSKGSRPKMPNPKPNIEPTVSPQKLDPDAENSSPELESEKGESQSKGEPLARPQSEKPSSHDREAQTDSHPDHLKIISLCALVLAGAAIAAGTYWLRAVLIPFTLAIFAYQMLLYILELQVRYFRLSRAGAIVTTFLLATSATLLLFLLVTNSIYQLMARGAAYEARLAELVWSALNALPNIVGELILPRLEGPLTTTAGDLVNSLTAGLLDVIYQSTVVLVFLVFFFMRSKVEPGNSEVWIESCRRVRAYLAAKFGVSALIGVLVGLLLWVLGVDLALVFGLCNFVLNFIPVVGPLIGILLPLPMVLLTPGVSVGAAILAISGIAAIHFFLGNIVETKVMGDSLDLDPVVLLLSLIFFSMVWGWAGALLAAPLTSVMQGMISRSELVQVVRTVFAPAPSL